MNGPIAESSLRDNMVNWLAAEDDDEDDKVVSDDEDCSEDDYEEEEQEERETKEPQPVVVTQRVADVSRASTSPREKQLPVVNNSQDEETVFTADLVFSQPREDDCRRKNPHPPTQLTWNQVERPQASKIQEECTHKPTRKGKSAPFDAKRASRCGAKRRVSSDDDDPVQSTKRRKQEDLDSYFCKEIMKDPRFVSTFFPRGLMMEFLRSRQTELYSVLEEHLLHYHASRSREVYVRQEVLPHFAKWYAYTVVSGFVHLDEKTAVRTIMEEFHDIQQQRLASLRRRSKKEPGHVPVPNDNMSRQAKQLIRRVRQQKSGRMDTKPDATNTNPVVHAAPLNQFRSSHQGPSTKVATKTKAETPAEDSKRAKMIEKTEKQLRELEEVAEIMKDARWKFAFFPSGGKFNKIRPKQVDLHQLLRNHYEEYIAPSMSFGKSSVVEKLVAEQAGNWFIYERDTGFVAADEAEVKRKIRQKLRDMKKYSGNCLQTRKKTKTPKKMEERLEYETVLKLKNDPSWKWSFFPSGETFDKIRRHQVELNQLLRDHAMEYLRPSRHSQTAAVQKIFEKQDGNWHVYESTSGFVAPGEVQVKLMIQQRLSDMTSGISYQQS